MVTEVAFARPVPVTMTLVPTAALVVESEVIAGTGTTTTLVDAEVFPPMLVSTMGEVPVAPTGIVKVNVVGPTESGVVTTAPTFTEVTAARFVPVSVTCMPTEPEAGLMPEMVGAGTNVKFVPVWYVPVEVVIDMRPVDAPAGTFAEMTPAEVLTAVPATPLKRTAEAVPRPVPLMVTTVPTPPVDGLNEVIDPVPAPVPALGTL